MLVPQLAVIEMISLFTVERKTSDSHRVNSVILCTQQANNTNRDGRRKKRKEEEKICLKVSSQHFYDGEIEREAVSFCYDTAV